MQNTKDSPCKPEVDYKEWERSFQKGKQRDYNDYLEQVPSIVSYICLIRFFCPVHIFSMFEIISAISLEIKIIVSHLLF